ncbi:Predicted oxidoreductase [Clostridium collagenovorans DSM 3089]|uniref:Predicted oxidoreductase n=1 Tax=Clostridium collagenovorans DSM 3089 TaxID=1121306 RepID=A0A1M5VUA1_9CLOT|nr:aldo/keto reductase [Clostridium collagenovorans]SHH78554.1 Predicted oxidoreductase [Clostridium collagenovorans DSM 3089]
MIISGYATIDGTKEYFLKKGLEGEGIENGEYFNCSKIAIGTNLGDFSDEDSKAYKETFSYGLNKGINFIDTAINYRGMRSEGDIGEVLKKLIVEEKIIKREEIIISSKGGQIFGDCLKGIRPMDYLNDKLFKGNILNKEDVNIIDNRRHTMNPKFYKLCIEQSKENLNLKTLDIHYIHDPEISRFVLGEKRFYEELTELIKFYESQVEEGNIKHYGMATWEAFICSSESQWHISLEKVMDIVKVVAGNNHNFRFIQLPYNKMNNAANTIKTQSINGKMYTAIEACKILDLNIIINAPLNQMENIEGKGTMDELLRYVIETKGVFSTMVGMKKKENLINNMESIFKNCIIKK